jgi:hypothetical protein
VSFSSVFLLSPIPSNPLRFLVLRVAFCLDFVVAIQFCLADQATSHFKLAWLQESKRAIKEFRGTRTKNVKIGTIMWRCNNDQGKHHKFVILKSFYVP